jgi:hypothetical protein
VKKLITICVTAGLMFAVGTPVANGSITISYGTPSPTLSPTFGTLVNFDDKAVGTSVSANDYVPLGVNSIVELEGLGFFGRYNSSQSAPCFVGTGSNGERGTDASGGWDGTIQIDLTRPASMVGIGIANNSGGPETLSVYDSVGILLKSYTVTTGTNVYAVITSGAYDISRLEISGDFFAIDDLQFNAIPAPGAILLGSIGAGLVGWLRRRRTI